jgi:hypothetical protein
MKRYLTICVFSFAGIAAVFSHAMFLELIEPGVFQVEYDGGGFTPGTTVILYSDAGFTKVQEGIVDDKGLYKFDPALKIMTAEAADGAGHVAYWEAGAETETPAEKAGTVKDGVKTRKTKRPSKIPTVLTVLNTCALIYLFFEFRTFKKAKKN